MQRAFVPKAGERSLLERKAVVANCNNVPVRVTFGQLPDFWYVFGMMADNRCKPIQLIRLDDFEEE